MEQIDSVQIDGPHSTPARPTGGGLISLHVRSPNLIAWLGPAWATLCGAITSHTWPWQRPDLIQLALLILLVDVGWGTVWAALGDTNWARPFRRWRHWRSGSPALSLPYTRPGAPGDGVSRWLGHVRAWARDVFWPACGPALLSIGAALPLIFLLSAILGPIALLASAAALAVMQIGLTLNHARGNVEPEWDALIGLLLPWLTGHRAFGPTADPLALSSVGLALAFTVTWSASRRARSTWGRGLIVASQCLVLTLLVILQRPMAAAGLALLSIPPLALSPWMRDHESGIDWYIRHTQPWLMASMLIAALAL